MRCPVLTCSASRDQPSHVLCKAGTTNLHINTPTRCWVPNAACAGSRDLLSDFKNPIDISPDLTLYDFLKRLITEDYASTFTSTNPGPHLSTRQPNRRLRCYAMYGDGRGTKIGCGAATSWLWPSTIAYLSSAHRIAP
eukprot:3940920-Rhodomonas_salina.3